MDGKHRWRGCEEKRIGEKKVGEMIGKDDGEVGGDHVLDGDGDEQ